MRFCYADPLKHCSCPQHEGPNPVPVSRFGPRPERNGLRSRCKACEARKRVSSRNADPEESRQQERQWRQANPGKIRAKNRRVYWAAPEKAIAATRRGQQRARDQVLDHYGRACACCGTTESLGIDRRMYRWLIKQGFPDGFQVLCNRCNSSKGTGPACRIKHRSRKVTA